MPIPPQNPAQLPPPSATPAPPGVTGQPLPAPTPRSGQDYALLRGRQNEMQKQLQLLESRREQIARQIQRTGDEAERARLTERVGVIDKQITALDRDLGDVGRQMALAAPAAPVLAPSTLMPPVLPRPRYDETAAILGGLLTVFVLAPLAFAYARRLWRRSPAPGLPREWSDTPARLERLEHAVDTVAIEVERISESQRFMTRLLTETQLGPAIAAARASAEAARDAAQAGGDAHVKALGAGERPFEPIRVAEREGARLREDRR